MELIFEVREPEEGGYAARALGQAIFTEAETWTPPIYAVNDLEPVINFARVVERGLPA